MRRTSSRLVRLFFTASLIAALVPAAPATASSGTVMMGAEGIVSVVSQTTYTDARGVRWVDAVVSNDTGRALSQVRVPITFVSDGVEVGDEVVVASALPYAIAPGKTATVHLELDTDTPDSWEPVVNQGSGASAPVQPRMLEVTNVEQIDADAAAQSAGVGAHATVPAEEPDSADGELPDDEAVPEEPAEDPDDEGSDPEDDADVDLPEAEAAMRTYRLSLLNSSDVAINHVRVSGAEYADGALLDTVASDTWDTVVEPGQSISMIVYGMADPDDPSAEVTLEVAASGLESPVVTLKASTVAPAYGKRVVLTAKLARHDGTPLGGDREMAIAWSTDGEEWETVDLTAHGGTAVTTLMCTGPLVVKALFWVDDEFGSAESDELAIKPVSEVTEPAAPTAVAKNASFSVTGLVKPDYAAGTRKVKLEFYRFEKGEWKLRKTSLTTTKSYPGAYAKYTAKVKLTATGKWKVRANNPGDSRARGAVSGFDYLTVR